MRKEFDRFATSYKQLKRSIYGLPVLEVICMLCGKLMDSLIFQIPILVFFAPFFIIMTIHDYKRLIKLKIEEPNPGLLTKLLIIQVITWIVCFIIIFLLIPSNSRF